MNIKSLVAKSLFVICLLAAGGEARADTFTITLDTRALVSGGKYFVNFQLTNHDSAPNNTITLTNFNFGGGAAVTPAVVGTLGGASGSFESGVTLTDSNFGSLFGQQFRAGNSLQFNLTLSSTASHTAFPDSFSFSLLDEGGSVVSTTGPSGAFLILNIRSGITVGSFQTFGVPGDIPPPVVTLTNQAAPVPEPATLLLFGAGLAGAGAAARRRRAARRSSSN
jgi:hypothetical protein